MSKKILGLDLGTNSIGWALVDKDQEKILFTLKQDDSVYLPDEKEKVILRETITEFKTFWSDKVKRTNNVYKVVKFSGNVIYFLKHDIAKVIVNKLEFGSQNCYEKVNGIIN